jgi:protein O-GlcNAc transferase
VKEGRFARTTLLAKGFSVEWGSDKWQVLYDRHVFQGDHNVMDVENTIRLVEELFQKGDLKGAESACRDILEIDRGNEYALHMLGIIYYELEEYDKAKDFLERALQANPASADTYYDMGNVHSNLGNLDEAILNYRKAIETDPMYVDAYNNLGTVLHDKGNIDEAIDCYEKALEINPGAFRINNNVGLALQDKGMIDEAMVHYQKALQMTPNYADALYNLGNVLQYKGQHDEAVACYKRAIEIEPDFVEAHYKLANSFKEQDMLDEALSHYNRTIALNMDFAEIYLNIGYILDHQGKKEEALEAFGRALDRNPDLFTARFAQCMAQVPFIYKDEESIYTARKKYREELLKLRGMLSDDALDINSASDAAGSLQPFLLAYQGFNDRELQCIYGDLINKIMSRRYPEYSERPPVSVPLSGEKIRVGIVSGYFYRHSNWKIPIKGWVENIDGNRFSLYGYYTGKAKDAETDAARRYFDKFVEDVFYFEELCKLISRDRLHVLIYPEIGMDPLTLRIASLKLAPVQCASWGHPETSGLPTIDYFLSSELMEPPDGETHYTEKLIRLPRLSVYYKPLTAPSATAERSDFGLEDKSLLYLCCQSLFKYLPQYDEVYPRIALQVPDCKFLFISNPVQERVTEIFRLRLGRAFERFGLNADDYVVFLPRLSPGQYIAVNRMADIYLDSIGWSGCNSTFEAIECGLPIVTFRGELMRGRHSSAILGMMDVEETVADTLEEYVSLATRLGLDADLRTNIAEKICDNRHLIYEDHVCIKGLEDFIEQAVNEAA